MPFDGVWIEDQSVLGVTPKPELKPVFDLQYAGLSVATPTGVESARG